MKIFLNREMKLLFAVTAAVLFGFIILGQIAVKLIAEDYKQSMMQHDYEVAGYLYRGGMEKSQIVTAFTAEKTEDDSRAGQELLQAAGYTSGIRNSLLPEVGRFYQKYAVLTFILSVGLSMAVLAALLFFALRQEKRIEKASADIRSFMDGNVNVRLDDDGEGSFSRLFSSINGMATSLSSHIVKEKQGKEFLKDTISDISHQLKTPLAALRMYNEIIQHEKTGSGVVDDFALKSERELNRLETLIKNLLKLAKLDSGSIELEKSTHNLKVFLEDAIKGFHTRADLEGKSITLDCDEHIILTSIKNGCWKRSAISSRTLWITRVQVTGLRY